MELFTNETTNAQRFLALWFPHLPAERIMRLRFGRSWRSQVTDMAGPIVFSRRENNTQRVAALDERAEALRLRIGIGIAEARAMFPSIEVIEEDPAADSSMLAALADWCDRYTPLVALDGLDGLFLDITGCAHLFGGERALLDDLLARFAHQGFDARAAIASTPGAAWAGARYASATILEPGAQAGFIAPLPLAALRLDQPTRDSLQSVGLRVAGALMNAPRAPLVRRFGKMVTLRLDQAIGRVEEPVSPRLPPPLLSVERRFFEPLTQVSDIEELVPVLARQLRSELERREEGARHLELQLFRVDGAVSRVTVMSSRPLRDPRLIGRLFRERFAVAAADIDPGYGFDLVRLAVLAAAPFRAEQIRLDETDSTREGDMALFADRVRSRFGNRAISSARLAASHMPERASSPAPVATTVAPGQSVPACERPIRLFATAETVDVVAAEIPEGPPGRFRWRNVSYRVAAAEGPERMAPEWWRSDETDMRDYFRVEDEAGRRFWLYREGQYGVSERQPRWFMHGMFV